MSAHIRPTRGPGGGSFAIEKAVIFAAAALAAAFALIHVTAMGLAVVTGHASPAFSPARALGVIRLKPYATGIHPGVHLLMIGITLISLLEFMRRLLRWKSNRTASITQRATAFDARHGWATAAAIRTSASVQQLMVQAPILRPRVAKPQPTDVGYLLGTSKGQPVWASVERSILVIGPPGSGKGLHIAINAILDAPGAVITTSTKPDNLKATLTQRATRGPVGAFDPQGMLGPHFEHLIA